jgi:very-short-patch-repair endonuclease
MVKVLKTNVKVSNNASKKKKKPQNDFFCALVRSDLKLEIVTEHRFHPVRRWRFDYAILDYKIAIEKDGGVWMKGGGAHSRPQNILRDMEKLTQAALLGWTVIRRTPDQLSSRETLDMIQQAVELKKGVLI